jgi:hypothetical protein
MTIDDIYYKTWTSTADSNWKYKLLFVPGSHTDLSSPTYYELPDDFLIGGKINDNYEDDIPLGLPLAAVMNIDINISSLNNVTWADIWAWIKAGKGTTQRSGYDIPNRWTLLSNNGDGTTNYNTIMFEGCQMGKPEREYKVQENKVVYNINIVHIIRTVLENVTFTQIATNSGALKTKKAWDIKYDRIDGVYTYLYHEYSGADLEWYTISNFYSLVQNYSDILLAYYRRDSSITFLIDFLFKNWTFYKTNFDIYQTKGAELTNSSEVYLLGKEKTGDTVVAGLFSTNTKNETLFEFDNLWDFYKVQYENEFSKIFIDLNHVDTYPYYYVRTYPIYDGTGKAQSSIDNADITAVNSLLSGWEVSKKSMSHMKESNDSDINELTYWLGSQTNNESKLEFEHLFDNVVKKFAEKDSIEEWNTGYTNNISVNRVYPTYRNLYYNSSVGMFKVNDYCELNLGDSQTISCAEQGVHSYRVVPTNSPKQALQLTESNGTKTNDFIRYFTQYRQNEAGIPFVTAEAGVVLLGNSNQGMIEVDLLPSNGNVLMLGDDVIIDINGIMPNSEPTEFELINFHNRCIFTNIEQDLKSGIAKCKLFIRSNEVADLIGVI